MDRQRSEDLINFPCDYQFKAVGMAGDEFKQGIVSAVKKYVGLSSISVSSQPSNKATYQSVSILTKLYSYQQLTDIYAEMKSVPGLKMLL